MFGALRLSGLDRATAQLAGFEAAGLSTADSLLGMSRGTALLVGGLGLLGTALTIQGVRKFASFDEAMTESLAIMGDVSQSMEDEMAAAARNMARETIFSADQTAEAYFFLASAGLNAEQSIAALPQVAQFAQAGMFDMARATELATDAQSALGLSSDNVTQNLLQLKRVTDVLVGANTLANATVEQFAESLTNRAAPRLRQMNKTLEEGTAALAVFADQGIKGRRAGTLLDMTLRELSRRARENEAAFEDAGVEVFKSGGEMNNLADIIEDLEGRMEGLSVKQRSAELAMLGFQQRSIRGILALIGMSDQLRQYEKDLVRMGGKAEEVADKQLDTLIKQIKLLGSEISDVFIGGGEGPASALAGMVENTRLKIQQLRQDIEDLPEALDELDRRTGAPDITGFLGEVQPISVPAEGLVEMGFRHPDIEEDLQFADEFFNSLKKIHDLPPLDPTKFDLIADTPFNAEQFQQEVETITGDTESLLDLIDARREADLGIGPQLSQLQSAESDLNRLMEQRVHLTNTQRANIRGLLNTIGDLREEISDAPLAEEIQQIVDDSQTLVGLSEIRGQNLRTMFQVNRNLLGIRERINTLLQQDNISLERRLELERAQDDVLRGLESLAPDREVAQQGMRRRGAIDQIRTDAELAQHVLNTQQGEIEQSWGEFGERFGQDMARIGGNLIMSLGRGAEDKSEMLKDMFFQILNSVIQTAVQVFLIASPSRVMRDIGGQITMGLAEGLADEAGRVQRTWMQVLRGIETSPQIGMSPVVPGMGSLMGAGGSQRVQAALTGMQPRLEVNVDTSKIPEPRTPFDVSRDAEWQKALRESIDVAVKDGFKVN